MDGLNNNKPQDIRDELLLDSLFRFFSVAENVKALIDILSPKCRITRSMIDWFVTTYVENNNVEYIHQGKVVNVWKEHRAQLTRFGKKRSDPFCREGTFKLETGVADKPTLTTSARQLCFMRWAIKLNILGYIDDHFDTINREYRLYKEHTKLKKKTDNIGKAERTQGNEHIIVTYYSKPLRVYF